MRYAIKTAVILYILLVNLTLSFAEEEKTSSLILKLDDLKIEGLESSPELASQRSQLRALLAEIDQEARLLNPTLEGQVDFPQHYPNDRGDNEFEIALSQTIRMGDFGKRELISRLMQKQAKISNDLQLLETMQKISLTYYRLWALQQEVYHLRDIKTRVDKLSEVFKTLSEQGRVSSKDNSIVKSTAARVRADQEGLNFEINSVNSELTKLTGRSISGIKTNRPALPKLPPLESIKAQAERSETGVAARMKLMYKLASQQENLAKTESFPDLTPRVSYSHNDEGKDFIGVGISFDLPFFQSNRAEREKARGEMQHAKSVRKYISSGAFDSELESAYLRVKSKQNQAKIFDKQVVPELLKALRIAHEQYENGQSSMLELWQLEKEYHQALDEGLSLWIAAYAALGDLELLIGSEIEGVK